MIYHIDRYTINHHMSIKKHKIIGLTTDPYDKIYGYSLVFFRLMDFLQRNYKELDVTLIANQGTSSTIVKNPCFKLISIKKDGNIIIKTFVLIFNFIKFVFYSDKDTVIIANSELPELIAALLLKIKFKNVYGIIQDDRVRNNCIYTTLVCKTRIILLYAINDVIFTNRYTMSRFNNSINKYYIGNPIFY